ncbi:GIY-YIG nuclease family protein [Maribacter sp.]|nr:GIY-YIG nuclease family protein [Maribacter sp.]
MHYLYIIYNQTIDRYYIGESPDVINRLGQHNSHYFKKGYTKAAQDWKIVLSKKCENKEDAQYLERFMKRMKSKKFIQKIIQDQKILNDILEKR